MGLILFRETLCMEGIKKKVAIKHFKTWKMTEENLN